MMFLNHIWNSIELKLITEYSNLQFIQFIGENIKDNSYMFWNVMAKLRNQLLTTLFVKQPRSHVADKTSKIKKPKTFFSSFWSAKEKALTLINIEVHNVI